VPVVASRVGGLPEVIQDGVTGFIRDVDDVDGMTACALELLSDRALRERIGATATADVRARYCTDSIVPQYEACYEDVLRG
jgi:glycosyltransferase involved in cell wall biosynthesis